MITAMTSPSRMTATVVGPWFSSILRTRGRIRWGCVVRVGSGCFIPSSTVATGWRSGCGLRHVVIHAIPTRWSSAAITLLHGVRVMRSPTSRLLFVFLLFKGDLVLSVIPGGAATSWWPYISASTSTSAVANAHATHSHAHAVTAHLSLLHCHHLLHHRWIHALHALHCGGLALSVWHWRL